MRIEAAYIEGQHRGFRICVNGEWYSIHNDQNYWPGVRLGDIFVPGIGKEAVFNKCDLVEGLPSDLTDPQQIHTVPTGDAENE